MTHALDLYTSFKPANTDQEIRKMVWMLKLLMSPHHRHDKDAIEEAIVNYTASLSGPGHTAYVWEMAVEESGLITA